MDMISLLQEAGYTPKKKAACHGGEFACACPFCKEGDDRFLSWPKRSNNNGEYQGGRFSCRVCGKYGDAITFLRQLHGLTYKEACERLKIEPKDRRGISTLKIERKLPVAEEPSKEWQNKALAFVEWSHTQLMKNQEAKKLLVDRGFSEESIIRFKLGFNSGIQKKDIFREKKDWGLEPELKEDGTPKKLWLPIGLVIPTFSSENQIIKIKIRRSDWKKDDKLPKYVEISGSKRCPSIYGNIAHPAALILESEFDSLLIQQSASDLVYCVALGGSTKPIDFATDQLLRKTSTIFFSPDFDDAGGVAWIKWKKMFPTINRLVSPDKKSAGDAYIAGYDLREWIKEALNSKCRPNSNEQN